MPISRLEISTTYSNAPTRVPTCRFVDVSRSHPSIRLGLHYTGPLLEWIERAHPGIFRAPPRTGRQRPGGNHRRRILRTDSGHHSAGGPPRTDYAARGLRRKAFQAPARAAPGSPSASGSRSFLRRLLPPASNTRWSTTIISSAPAFELDQLYGYYLCEDLGALGESAARPEDRCAICIPFRDVKKPPISCATPPPRIRAASRPWATTSRNSAFGPERTSTATRMAGSIDFSPPLEQNSDWLATSTPGDAVASRFRCGRADLPTASYTEMMEWSLPTPARDRYHGLRRGVFIASRCAALSARRHLARLFHQVRRIESPAQENAARFEKGPRSSPTSRRRDKRFQARAEEAGHVSCAGPVQRSPTGTAFSADFTRRIFAPRFGALVDAPKRSPRASTTAEQHYADVRRTGFRCRRTRGNLFHVRPLCRPGRARLTAAPSARSIFARRTSTLINSLARRPESLSRAAAQPATQARRQARSPFTTKRAPKKRASNAGCNTTAGPAILSACCCSAGTKRSGLRLGATRRRRRARSGALSRAELSSNARR